MLIINEEAYNYNYFAAKNLSELYSLGWLRSKKEAISNGGNDFENALTDALNYQKYWNTPRKNIKIKALY